MTSMAFSETQPVTSRETSKRAGRSRRIVKYLFVVLVVILVTIAGITLYVMTLGYGSDGYLYPTAAMGQEPTTNGVRWTFGYWQTEDSKPVSWNEINITLTDGEHIATWDVIPAEELDTGTSVTHNCGFLPLGNLTVSLTIIDIAGNGVAEWRDGFEIDTAGGAFSSQDIYLVLVVWIPANSSICTDYIWGY